MIMRSRLAFFYGFMLLFPPAGASQGMPSETIDQALCRLIEGAAQTHEVPRDFLTKLIWRESSFRTGVVSSAGAQGVAQFMPGTARERGLTDPFDPEQAIPKAAELIAALTAQLGNLGLAAAAYNGGQARVLSWLEGRGDLPAETRSYVISITGRAAEEWAGDTKKTLPRSTEPQAKLESCLQIVSALRTPAERSDGEAPFAPWGVQLAGNFSKAQALSTYMRASQTYASLLKDARPMIIGTRLHYRGSRTFYRVRAPADTRRNAEELCQKIRSLRGSCIVLPS